MAAAPRAAPAIIDNATVYRVFMLALPIARRTRCPRRALAIMLRSRAGAQSTKFRLAAAIAFNYDYGHTSALEGIVSKRLGSPYRSGRSRHWVKSKNPAAPAVKREAEEDWGKERWR